MGIYRDILNENGRTNGMLHELSTEESALLKKTLLEIYDDVVMVCEKYNIQPIMVSGTALGAVRHKGFIPWDDDLDIAMERSQYNLFKEVFDKELAEKYEIMSANKAYTYNRFTQIFKKGTVYRTIGGGDKKIQKIYIDIFPIDYAPESDIIRGIKGVYCNLLMAIASQACFFQMKTESTKKYMCTSLKGKIVYNLKCVMGALVSFVPCKKWFDLLDKHIQNKKSNKCGILVDLHHYFGECVNSEVFFPPSIGEFEGRKVFLPHDVHSYLTKIYGEYMTIPPVEKRERHFMLEIKF